jgi:hypothetical protein
MNVVHIEEAENYLYQSGYFSKRPLSYRNDSFTAQFMFIANYGTGSENYCNLQQDLLTSSINEENHRKRTGTSATKA